MSTRQLTRRDLEQIQRPDSQLPAELRHDDIIDVSRCHSRGVFSYEIVFDGEKIPYSFLNPEPEEWEILHARIVYRKPSGGLLDLFRRKQPKIAVQVAQEYRFDMWDGEVQ